jgi:hypothetical protein
MESQSRHKTGDTVTVHCEPDELVDHHSWLQGEIVDSIEMIHLVKVRIYRPEGEQWRTYDGVPIVKARELRGVPVLKFIEAMR